MPMTRLFRSSVRSFLTGDAVSGAGDGDDAARGRAVGDDGAVGDQRAERLHQVERERGPAEAWLVEEAEQRVEADELLGITWKLILATMILGLHKEIDTQILTPFLYTRVRCCGSIKMK